MRLFYHAIIFTGCLSLLMLVPCEQIWEFNNLEGWEYEHQDNNPVRQLDIRNGILRIYTRAYSLDRKKIHTRERIYTSGRYNWRTYISNMGKGDQASIGNFLYCDDHHELDFEVGYGKRKIRKDLDASKSDMIAYMTSQDFPFQSEPVKIQTGWHLFSIDLKLVDRRYLCFWFIDGILVSSLQLNYGSDYKFYIYCSVENLKFIGDAPAKKNNYGLFDFVKYEFHD